ncbi:MAG: cyclodeaminase/cyclohydrolase family protein [Candidatus Omnitrophica bacterium]|nr:cyclodeaminase/cyclohydrolase family protein [Candidatus Omnitrophota bacterium]
MSRDSIHGYLDDLAGKKPAPGGGSAAALAGAVGCALISMVANFTVGKEKYKVAEDEMQDLLKKSEGLRAQLEKLVQEDIEAYGRFDKAYKMPKDTKGRKEAVEEALKVAASVPLEICRCAHRAMKLLPIALEKGNKNLITDVGVPAHILKAAFDSALMNVEVNLKWIKDEEFIAKTRKVLDPMNKETLMLKEKVVEGVNSILRGEGK